jgi:hypothetical protein
MAYVGSTPAELFGTLNPNSVKTIDIQDDAVTADKIAAGAVAYADVTGTPTLATVATTGAYSDVTGTPTLSTVATTGAYADVTGTPTLATVATTGAYADVTGTPTLATVATSGSYTDLINKPTISTTATNIAGGSVGTIPYQTAADTTAMLAVGTAGQALLSQGTSAPVWGDISAGETTFVASGTISSAGLTVALNADGTVSVVGQVGDSVGTPALFENTGGGDYYSATYDSSTNKVVIAYRDWGNSNYGTAIVGTVSGTGISFGTPVVFNNGDSNRMVAVFDNIQNKVVILYSDGSNSNYLSAIVGTVSGTSISFGTRLVVNSIFPVELCATFDSISGKVISGYTYADYQYNGIAKVLTVSGTSIVGGPQYIFNNATTSWISNTFDSSQNKVVFAFQDANPYYGKAVVAEVSGTHFTFGSKVTFDSTGDAAYTKCVFDSTLNKVVIGYYDGGNSGYGTAVVGTVSGTSISFGTPTVFHSGGFNYLSSTFDSNEGKVVFAYRNQSNSNYGTAILGTVSGTSISFGTPLVLDNTVGTQYTTTTYDSTAKKVVIAYQDNVQYYGRGIVLTPAFSTNTNSIGISQGSATNANPVVVKLPYQIDENQTGLTAGQLYYVAPNGALTTTSTDNFLLGRALSATKLLITNWSE